MKIRLKFSLESPHEGDFNGYTTYHYCIEDRKNISKSFPFASCPGAMINRQWLQLLKFRTHVHGPRDVPFLEVNTYNVVQ